MNRREGRTAGNNEKTATGPDTATPAALCELGHRHLEAGRTLDAQLCCQQALAMDPGFAEAMHLMGLLSLRAEQADHAIEWFARAVQSHQKPAYLLSLGNTLKQQGRLDEAFRALDKAVEIDIEWPVAWMALAQLLAHLNRRNEATLAFQHVLKLDPEHADAAFQAGVLLLREGKQQEALGFFDRSDRLRPHHAPTLQMHALARVLHDRALFEEALSEMDRADALDPATADIFNDMGDVHRRFGRHEEALTWFDKALKLRPDFTLAHSNKAYSLARLHRFDEALAIYAALKVVDHDSAEWNEALLQLLLGNFEAGWAGREARWKVPGLKLPRYNFSRPMWLGKEPIGGKTILIYQDEGLGDTIQFARYVPMVAAQGAHVILMVADALVPLLSNLSGVVRCIPSSVNQVLVFDTHCGITSLPLAFGTRLETIPSATAYLPAPEAARVRTWEERLGPRQKMRVGVVWSGNSDHSDDHNRSIALGALSPLLELDATFVSLQKDPRPGDRELLARTRVIDLTAHLTDFIETAALVSCLDLVITVDTSIAHLAGALACPTWILLPHTPDFRWLLGRDDSPWYPTARLFRQDASRDYAAVIARVQAELRERIVSWSPDSSRGRADRLQVRAGNYGAPASVPVPDDADSLHLMGLAALHQKQFDQAVEWLSRAIRCDPKPLYLTTLGTTLLSQGRRDEALLVFDKAVQLDSDSAETWKPLAQTLAALNRHHEAALAFQQVLKLDPQDADAAHQAGFMFLLSGKAVEALALLDRSDQLRANHGLTLHRRGLVLKNLARLAEAEVDLARAHALAPEDADICNDLGALLIQFGRQEEALTWLDRALRLRPDFKLAHNNKAYALGRLHRFDEALAIYAALKAADPDDAEPDWNAALLYLLTGNFDAGWVGREARWKVPGLPMARYDFALPMWLGQEPVDGKTILIDQDEGLGDMIQFARYAPMVAAKGARVILLVDNALVPLLSKLSGVTECIPRTFTKQIAFDFYCGVSSLPLAFGTRLETIPSIVPYLPASDPARVRVWEERLGRHDKLRVGLVWSGNPSHKDDHHRSLALRALTPLLDLDATFVSLQKDTRLADQATLREWPGVVDLTAHLGDFAETAALMTCLDLVITVDTSIAHLAGALACPTWILLPYTPDWRWLLDREDSPWYPTARLFRQDESRNYEGVIERVRSQLVERIEAWRASVLSPTSGQSLTAGSGTNGRTPAALCELGHQHLRAGRSRDAEVCCQQALAADPDCTEAMHLMGLLSLSAEQFDHAIECFARAVERDAKPRYLVSFGEALKRQGRVEEAFKAFDRAVELDIDSAEAWKPLAQILADLNRHHEAALAFQHVLKLDPQDADAAYQAGFLFFRAGSPQDALAMIDLADRLRSDHAPTLQVRALLMGDLCRLEEAVAELSRAHALAPDDADICSNIGVFLQRLGRQKEALTWSIKALARRPDSDSAYQAGLLLFHSDRPEEALAHLDRADRLRPDHAPILLVRALVIGSLDRFEEAVAELSRAHALAPDDVDICNNMGVFLQRLDRDEEALIWFDRALARKPDYASVFNNKGFTLGRLHRFDEALAVYAALLAIEPNNAEAEWSASLLHLLTGNFELGWAGREARWKVPNQPLARYDFSGPMWAGKQPVDGKSILIYQDEGLGDAIQFVRYMPMLASFGARVILLVDDALVPLLSELPGVVECVPKSVHRSLSFDAHCAVTSLPLAFNTTLATIPAEVPYLPAPAESRRQIWDGRLGPYARMRVGLVWSGNPKHRNDRDRSICLRALLPLLDLDATFVSLQKEPRPDDQATLRERPDIVDLTVHLADLAETAALISCLDLVITVDTSLAHLAGALARPTWILLPYTPDYRWMLDREDSPWYPTARLFRQDESRDYEGVIERVRSQLAERIDTWRAGLSAL